MALKWWKVYGLETGENPPRKDKTKNASDN